MNCNCFLFVSAQETIEINVYFWKDAANNDFYIASYWNKGEIIIIVRKRYLKYPTGAAL